MKYQYDDNDHEVLPNITLLEDGHTYIFDDTVFKVCGDFSHDVREISSIPYYWLVRLNTEECHEMSTLGLPKNIRLRCATVDDYMRATKIVEEKTISFQNVERLMRESQRKLDEAMQMLNMLKNGQQG